MYEIDPARTDLIREFEAKPGGPYSAELTLVVNRLRLLPLAERHVLVCRKRGREWVLAKMPPRRGAPVALIEDHVFADYADAVREVFRRRWSAATGRGAGRGAAEG
ncbi:MAG: hypothetical protein EA355_05835 [Rhodobacteraceae bacterium]|nr:MAG: hypothetical protein EA355_05835 [Paracoccaceae bacterium]